MSNFDGVEIGQSLIITDLNQTYIFVLSDSYLALQDAM